MKTTWFAGVWAGLLLGAWGLPLALWAGLTYDGSVPLCEYVIVQASRSFEAKTGIKFDNIYSHGSDAAVTAVVQGKADIGGVARPLTADEKKNKIYFQIIGYDTLAVFVNAQNPVANLTTEQVKGIFTGKITNWRDVGGKDAAIVAVADNTPGRTMTKEFRKSMLGGADLVHVKYVTMPHEHLQIVSADPDAITFDSLPFGKKGTKAIALNGIEPTAANAKSGAYPASRPLHLVAKGLPQGEVKKFFDFILSAEGQAIVGKGFVPVK